MNRPAAGHLDFNCRQVSIEADGVEIERQGIFIHFDLAEICRRMGVARH